MNGLLRTVVLSMALWCAASLAAREPRFEPLGEPDPSAEPVSIATLLANPERFDRKPVRVIGAFRLQFEKSRICPRRDDLIRGAAKHCLWISLDHQRLGPGAKRLSSHNDKPVVIEGRFSTRNRGHLNQFPGSIGGVWLVMEFSPPPN
jgi:hypothetical protein